jgi:hypothetical protein
MPPRLIEHAGNRFYRYPDSPQWDKRAYFHNRQLGYLHRVVWAEANGPIPAGHEIHHISGDTFDNSVENLACVPVSEHRRMSAAARVFRTYRCDQCGVEFESQAGTRGKYRFCSGRCSQARARAEGRYKVERVCETCGAVFLTGKYGKARYCGNKCSAAARERGPGGTFRRL